MRDWKHLGTLCFISFSIVGCAKPSPDVQLIGASSTCDAQEVTEALAEGADINGVSSHGGETPLMAAAYNGCADVARSLLRAGARVDFRTAKQTDLPGDSALLEATTSRGNAETVQVLIDAGADIRMTDDEGETALGQAARYGQLEIVQLLVRRGSDVNALNVRGQSPLGESRLVTRLGSAPNFGTVAGHAAVDEFLRAQGGQDIEPSS